MTREEVAAMMLQGLLANPNVMGFNHNHGWGLVNCNEDQLADYAFVLADAWRNRAFGTQPTTGGEGHE